MTRRAPFQDLSRRERQIMDVVFERGEVTGPDIRDALPDPPSYSAVRAALRILERKGLLQHRQDGPRYLYSPTVPRDEAQTSALRRVVRTFFHGSAADTMVALMDLGEGEGGLDEDELEQLEKLLERARRRDAESPDAGRRGTDSTTRTQGDDP